MYQTRLKRLREYLQKEKIDYFLFADADGHFSEYVGEYFKMRTAFCGFTGSNGTLLVGRKTAYLWTDGRYFIQAQKELEGSGVTLMKMGAEGVPSVSAFIASLSEEEMTLGIDADYLSYKTWLMLDGMIKGKSQIRILKNCLRELLEDSPETIRYKALVTRPISVLPPSYTDHTISDRISDIRAQMKVNDVQAFFSGKLDANMWLMGIRGNDIAYNPFAFSYILITEKESYLFLYEERITDELKGYFKQEGVHLKGYTEVLSVLVKHCAHCKVASLYDSLSAYITEQTRDAFITWVDSDCGLSLRQAVKSKAEIKLLKEIYRKDSAAVCKFLFWLSNQKSGTVTEYQAASKMNELRREIKEFKDLSFSTIAAFGKNAAMMHYEPDEKKPVFIEDGNVFLLDSGGQYDGGTTDVTRTVSIGTVSKEIQSDYTAVVKGMLALQNAYFMYGCTGMNLDILARAPIWEKNLNYNCGTGHGIGFMLGVHEGPQAIRTKASLPASETPFSEGMLVSDEPGIYKEGKYGIRVENILLCSEACRNEEGVFMKFEPLTFVPLDMKLICADELSEKEKLQIEEYQNAVCENMRAYLSPQEYQWLEKQNKII